MIGVLLLARRIQVIRISFIPGFDGPTASRAHKASAFCHQYLLTLFMRYEYASSPGQNLTCRSLQYAGAAYGLRIRLPEKISKPACSLFCTALLNTEGAST